jgi:serine/threonine protein kinase
MGDVYAAWDSRLGRSVAVKLLWPGRGEFSTSFNALHREVTLARRVAHPGVCRVFEGFVHRWPGSERRPLIGIAMELVPGETLAQRIRCRGPFAPPAVIDVGRDVAAALDAAHRAGVVHRDVKASNVLLAIDRSGPRAVLVDFGVASIFPVTARGRPAVPGGGTPGCIAPECLDGRPATPAADVYGFGLLLLQMATGSPSPRQLRVDARGSVGESLHRAPAPGRPVLERCIAPDPRRRIPSAGAVIDLLRQGSRAFHGHIRLGGPPRW